MTHQRTNVLIDRDQRPHPLVALSVHGALFAGLTFWSWRKWPDPLIDFGRELYTPWQLMGGSVLYRDVASIFGPFSRYLNALWFALLGPSLMTLVAANLTVLALLTWGLYVFIRDCCDRFTANATTLTVLVIFGFSQYGPTGSFNFVAPYSHEATHGIALAIGIFLSLMRGLRSMHRVPFMLAGLFFGCLWLTKPETSIAVTAGLAAASTQWRFLPFTGAAVLNRLLFFLAASFVAPLAFFCYFLMHVPPQDALRAVSGSWPVLFVSGATNNAFYAEWLGFDRPLANVAAALKYFAGFVAFCAVAVGLSALKRPASELAPVRTAWRLLRMVLIAGSVIWIPWEFVPRCFPVILGFVLFALIRQLRQAPQLTSTTLSVLALIAWASFALALTAKMLLNVRLYHYGFYLGLPATTVAIVAVLWLIPNTLTNRGGDGRTFRSLAVLMLVSAAGAYFVASHGVFRHKTLPVAAGADRFYAIDHEGHWQGRAIEQVLSYLDQHVPRNATVAVLPEGVMINFLARRRNPTPYITFMLPELRAFGEEHMLRAFTLNPPDYVILVSRDTSEYGVPRFGVDQEFGKSLMDWVVAHYRPVRLYANQPVRDGGTGIEVLRFSALFSDL